MSDYENSGDLQTTLEARRFLKFLLDTIIVQLPPKCTKGMTYTYAPRTQMMPLTTSAEGIQVRTLL